jgi:dTDP-glucose pyrophosphorylase
MINIVVPLSGEGKRFKDAGFDTPKPLILANKKTLIEHAINTIGIDGQFIFITKKYKNNEYNKKITDILKSLKPDCIEIKVDKKQRGAADAILYAKDFINNKNQLITINCDQIMNWKPDKFIDFIENKKPDASVVVFKSQDPKHSYAEIVEGKIVKIVEKSVISNTALVGIHYWKNGSSFIESAENLLNKDLSDEIYVSQTFNYLISNNVKVLPYEIEENEYINLGTPNDLEIYLGKSKEFYEEKAKTIFCDIDGTILKHVYKFSEVGKSDPESLPGVIEKFNEWDSKGYKIVLTTARKESARRVTEKQLSTIGIAWDYLLMGITSGKRILINDKLVEQDENRAESINVITNKGFTNFNWEEIGL